jgi:hypothetical protein
MGSMAFQPLKPVAKLRASRRVRPDKLTLSSAISPIVVPSKPMPFELADIRFLIETGDFQQLIGEFESQHLDGKAQPYSFGGGNDAKREFAKDVAAFANANGGCIIIGAETTLSSLQAGEQITALKPFPETLFNADQYGKILDEWLYPAPTGLIIKWFPEKDTPQSGIGVIFVPAQAPETKPFLLTRTFGDRKSTEIQLGYAERHLDRTDIKSVVELHHAMRIGMNLEATLLNRITNLETLLQRHFAIPEPGPSKQSTLVSEPAAIRTSEITAKRVERIRAQEPLGDARTLIIVITPVPRSELQSIFSDHPDSIRRAIENPYSLRAFGWGIRTGAAARFVDGEFVQTESYRHVLNLYRDGEFIVATRIDRDSLAWSDKTDSTLHPLALVEFLTNTLNFYRLVVADMRIEPSSLNVEVRLGDLFMDTNGTSLPAGPIETLGWTSGSKAAPAAEWSRTISIDPAYDPARAAFLLLREVYVWFGHPEEAIPYTTGTGVDKAVDIRGIKAIG